MKDKVKELMGENEKLRMQLSACGVAALSNTANSAEKMRCISSEYKSASWQSVCDAVDREMAFREQCEKLFDALQIITETAQMCDGWSSFPIHDIDLAKDTMDNFKVQMSELR